VNRADAQRSGLTAIHRVADLLRQTSPPHFRKYDQQTYGILPSLSATISFALAASGLRCGFGVFIAPVFNGRFSTNHKPKKTDQEDTMKRLLTTTVISLALALAPAALATQNANKAKAKPAKTMKTMSPRAEALKKCNDDYAAAVKKANADYAAAVKDAKGKKGKDRAEAMKAANKAKKDALAAAAKAKKDCIAAAPKK
jgi:hypothetical protein